MANNRGKQFEAKFKEDFLKIPDSTIDRLYDSVSGYKSISNICDFIGYRYPNIFYLECKSHEGNTFPFTKLTQYEKLLPKVGIKGVRAGAVIWAIDHQKVFYVPISTITKMKADGKKSFHFVKDTDIFSPYKVYEIPSTLKRVFLDSDYTILTTLQEGE